MALRTVTLSNTIDQWKDLYNELAVDVGDLSTLTTTADSNLVSAINSLIGKDSAGIVTVARSSLVAGSNISYDSATGVVSLAIANNTITFNMMADSSVGTAELRNDAVTFAKMADSSVGTAELRNDAVTTVKIADNAVTFSKMADSAVGSGELRQAVQLILYNSAGTAVKTLYGAGE